MEQDHRPLGQHTEGDGRTEQHPWPPARLGLSGIAQRDQPGQREDGQRHVEHRQACRKRKDDKPRQCQCRPPADPGHVRPKPAAQHRCQPQGDASRQRPDHAGGEFADPGEHPDQVDRPEQQRRLVAVKRKVLRRHQPVAAQVHLPGDGKIAGLVDRQQRSQRKTDKRAQQQRRHGHEQVAVPAHAESFAALRSLPISIRLRV